MTKLQHYWNELQRRHVVKAGIAYLALSWVLVEVATAVLPLFEVSDVFLKGLVILMAIGFPIWLIIAWVYDFSPQGIKKTKDVPFNPAVSTQKNLQLNRVIIGGLSIAVILLVVNQVRLTTNRPEGQPAMASMLPNFTSSIAVLAFDDMSPEKDQEWLSDGISEEILNKLAQYKDLRVESRTNSFAYKGKDITIDVIGRELNVAYILEGSVRKAGETFRITVQLINASDGVHIWSDTFDRKFEDALQVQDEIAQLIAERLKLTLLHEDVRSRKVDPEAYELYLRGVHQLQHFSKNTTLAADSLIRRSIKIDPGYSQAWSALSMTTLHKGLYYELIEKSKAVSIGLEAANKAIELDSTNILGYNWLSNWQWHDYNGKASLKTLNKLLELNSNNKDVIEYAAHAFQRMGMVQQSRQILKRGIQLYPKYFWLYYNICYVEYGLGNFAEAKNALILYNKGYKELTGQLQEASTSLLAWLYYKTNEPERAYETLAEDPHQFYRKIVEVMIKYSEGLMGEGDKLLEELKATPVEELSELEENLDFNLALIYASKGDVDSSFKHLFKSYDYLLNVTELLWSYAEFQILHDDPRWGQLLDRLGKEFNFDFNSTG